MARSSRLNRYVLAFGFGVTFFAVMAVIFGSARFLVAGAGLTLMLVVLYFLEPRGAVGSEDSGLDIRNWRFEIEEKFLTLRWRVWKRTVNGLLAAAFAVSGALVATAFLLSDGVPAISSLLAVPFLLLARLFWLDGNRAINACLEGTPILGGGFFRDSTDSEIVWLNAGRTLTPEFAHFQRLLDYANAPEHLRLGRSPLW